MRDHLRKSALTALALLTALIAAGSVNAAPPAESAGSGSTTPVVNVGDNFFSRTSTSIKKNKRVVFQWVDTSKRHNVTTVSGPRSFASATKRGDYRFSKKFTKKGTYKLNCTIHPDSMKTTVKVK